MEGGVAEARSYNGLLGLPWSLGGLGRGERVFCLPQPEQRPIGFITDESPGYVPTENPS